MGWLLEQGVAPGGGDERQPTDGRRRVAGRAHEARVLVVGHGKAADEELADVDAMDRAFVFLGVRRPHEEFAGGDTRQIWRRGGSHRPARPAAG
jgi:hypothetical protein